MQKATRRPDGVAEYLGATEMWLPSAGVRFALYFTKDGMYRWWFRAWGGQVPDEIAVLAHGSTPNASAAAAVRAVGRALRVPIVLWGDLDPGDLAAFATLVSGTPNLRRSAVSSASFLFGGIDDAFLDLVRRHVGARRFDRECRVRMSVDEKQHLEIVRRVCPPLGDLCGPRSLRLLESGYKCEVESVVNPRICKGVFLDKVREYFSDTLPLTLGL